LNSNQWILIPTYAMKSQPSADFYLAFDNSTFAMNPQYYTIRDSMEACLTIESTFSIGVGPVVRRPDIPKTLSSEGPITRKPNSPKGQ